MSVSLRELLFGKNKLLFREVPAPLSGAGAEPPAVPSSLTAVFPLKIAIFSLQRASKARRAVRQIYLQNFMQPALFFFFFPSLFRQILEDHNNYQMTEQNESLAPRGLLCPRNLKLFLNLFLCRGSSR